MLASIANVFEDGVNIDCVFFVFVLGTGIMLAGLLALTFVFLRAGKRYIRPMALVPAGTVAGIALFVAAGGPIMLATWLTAAALTHITQETKLRPSRLTHPQKAFGTSREAVDMSGEQEVC